jgi:hypothetical protein
MSHQPRQGVEALTGGQYGTAAAAPEAEWIGKKETGLPRSLGAAVDERGFNRIDPVERRDAGSRGTQMAPGFERSCRNTFDRERWR